MKIKHSEYFTHNYANELKSLVNELDINTYDEQIKKIETWLSNIFIKKNSHNNDEYR